MNEEDKVYLKYILECIDKIKDYSQGGKEEFLANSMGPRCYH